MRDITDDQLVEALLAGIEMECEVEATAEDAYSVMGPLDLRFLAGYLKGWFFV